jgi:hypothetical protein
MFSVIKYFQRNYFFSKIITENNFWCLARMKKLQILKTTGDKISAIVVGIWQHWPDSDQFWQNLAQCSWIPANIAKFR